MMKAYIDINEIVEYVRSSVLRTNHLFEWDLILIFLSKPSYSRIIWSLETFVLLIELYFPFLFKWDQILQQL